MHTNTNTKNVNFHITSNWIEFANRDVNASTNKFRVTYLSFWIAKHLIRCSHMLHNLSRLNERRRVSQNNWEAESGKPLKLSPYLSPKFVIDHIFCRLDPKFDALFQTWPF